MPTPPRFGRRPDRFFDIMHRVVLGIAGLFIVCQPVLAEEKPLFEVGVVGGAGYVPNYPASDESSVEAIALPYFVYRGEIIRAGDRGLVRGRIIRRRNVELDVSLSGSFSTDSDDNDARQGMPDLDYLVEVGPRLQLTLARAQRWAKVELELPVRAVFSTDLSSVDHRGFVFAPELAYQHENVLQTGTQLKLSIGAKFADEELQDYFYEVDERFATSTRPAFDADFGYLGSRLQLLATRPFGKRIRGFAGGAIDLHQGAANEDSPLFRDDVTYSAGIGLIWSFYQSDRTVDE